MNDVLIPLLSEKKSQTFLSQGHLFWSHNVTLSEVESP